MIRDADGRKLLSGITTDIKERKRNEMALADQAEELRRANVDLEHFASIASHDLQEPLRMIINYCDLLKRRYDPLFDDKARQYFGRVTNGAQRMRALITGLLAYSQVGKQTPALAMMPARRALDDALDNLQQEIAGKHAEVTINDLPDILSDVIRLTQLFQNLIANALKFTPADRRPTVCIGARDAVTEWVFSVADNGIGIDEGALADIFGIFQRLHTIDEYPGSGIGLATCKKIVEQHGGRIWVESVVDQGSTFSFAMPKRAAQ